jgi:5-methylcytosine-specific restriction enzyme A
MSALVTRLSEERRCATVAPEALRLHPIYGGLGMHATSASSNQSFFRAGMVQLTNTGFAPVHGSSIGSMIFYSDGLFPVHSLANTGLSNPAPCLHQNMNTYLYTWNPKRWTWPDHDLAIYLVTNGEEYERPWSCGNTKKIEIGDRFLLMRVGVEPKGIIACGYVSSPPYPLPHWNIEKAAQGRTALRTDLMFKALCNEPMIPLSSLQDHFPDYKWTPEGSGVTVPEPQASEVFSTIQSSSRFGFLQETRASLRLYAEGRSRVVTMKTYDRSVHARQACIEHYGYDCAVCGFNFERAYGTIGRSYVEVHHLRQLADAAEDHLVDPVRDLRPVCANCHRMLHKQRPPIAIETLMEHLRSCTAVE